MTEIVTFNNTVLSIDSVRNKIIQGDCLEVMRVLPEKSIDVIITSPPYNLLNSTGNGLKKIQTVEIEKRLY